MTHHEEILLRQAVHPLQCKLRREFLNYTSGT